MSDLAIYDMDRTVTRRATYTPFLFHCAMRRAPWRLLLLPLVLLSMLAYAARLIDRGRLKEINHRLLLGSRIHPRELRHKRVQFFRPDFLPVFLKFFGLLIDFIRQIARHQHERFESLVDTAQKSTRGRLHRKGNGYPDSIVSVK